MKAAVLPGRRWVPAAGPRAPALPLPAALAAFVLLAALLMGWRVEQALVELAQQRLQRAAAALVAGIERGHGLGLVSAAQQRLPDTLAALARQEPLLRGVVVLDDTGQVLATQGVAPAPLRASPRPPAAGGHAAWQRSADGWLLGAQATDPRGAPSAQAWLLLDTRPLRDATLQALRPLAVASAGLAWVLLLAARRWRGWRAAVLMATAALLVQVGLVRQQATPLVTSQALQGAGAAAQAVAARLRAALEAGVPADRLAGLDEALALQRDGTAGLRTLRVVDATGRALGHAGAPPVGGMAGGGGRLQVPVAGGIVVQAVAAPDLADALLQRMAADLLLAALIAGVLVVELVRPAAAVLADASGAPSAPSAPNTSNMPCVFGPPSAPSAPSAPTAPSAASTTGATGAAGAAGATGSTGATGATGASGGAAAGAPAAASGALRRYVFLLALGDELLRPFLAVHATTLAAPANWPAGWQAAAPVAAFMAALMLGQPLGAALARRGPLRATLLAGALLGAACLLGAAQAGSAGALCAWRAGSGGVYGAMVLVVQAALVRGSAQGARAATMAAVPAAIVAAGICGPLLGGLAADVWGAPAALQVCAVCLLLAGWCAVRLPAVRAEAEVEADASAAAAPGLWAGMRASLRLRTVAAVTWLAAVPARLAAGALLALLVPLMVDDAGLPPSSAGRLLALYFIAFLAVAGAAARRSDASGRRLPWLLAAALGSGLACALPALQPGSEAALAGACALLGAAQAALSAPQLALVTEAAQRGGLAVEPALAAFRLTERVGSVAAALLAGWAASAVGATAAAAWIGAGVAAAGVLLALLLAPWSERGDRR